MNNEDRVGEHEAIQRFVIKSEEILEEVNDTYPPEHIEATLALFNAYDEHTKSYSETSPLAAWFRDKRNEKPLADDERVLNKLRKEIPDVDGLLDKMNHRMMLNSIIMASRKGWSVAALCELMDSDAGSDPKVFQRELKRIVANRKLPN